MIRRLLSLLLSALVVLAGAARVSAQVATPTSAPRTGTVTGQIVNGTAGGSVPANLPVTLHAWDTNGETFKQEVVADAAGAFQLGAVPFQAGWTFGATVTRDSVTYFSETAAVAPETEALTLPLTLYDATTDTKSVTVSQLHALFDVLPTELRVVELYVLSNTGDRAVVGITALKDGRKSSLEFTLPAGANEVSFQGEGASQNLALTADGFAYTSPILPGSGTGQIMVSYVLPYTSGMTFSHVVRQPVAAASFIVQATTGVTLAGERLGPPDQQKLQTGAVVDIYSTGALQPGDAFATTLTGTPGGSAPSPTTAPASPWSSPWALPVGGALAGTAFIGVGLWLWRRNTDSEPEVAPDLDEAWEQAVQEIAALDEAHEEGELPDADYAARRAELQAQAKVILREREAERQA